MAATILDAKPVNIMKILQSAGSTASPCGALPLTLIERVKAHISDPDNYEDGEPRPSMATLRKLESLIEDTRAIDPSVFVKAPKISTFYGEIDLTWDTTHQMVRIIANPGDKATELYTLTKDGSPVPKGTVRIAEAHDVVDAIQHVYSNMTAAL